MKPTTAAIRMTELHKTFRTGLRRRPTAALRGLELEVAPGQVFGFLGPNGAGKTTAIKILVGLLRPDAGSAELLGRPVADPAARRPVAYLPELPDLYDYLRPAELLGHIGRLAGLDRTTLARRVPELLERVGLAPDEKRPLRKFSKGMLQRCGIAQAMLTDPELYILDEPMGGLDPIGRRWVKELIGELGRSGKTVFFSSHVLTEAEAVCDRVAFLRAGRLVAQGETSELLAQAGAGWELLVRGRQVRDDAALAARALEMRAAGPDTLLLLAGDQDPDAVVAELLRRGHALGGLHRRQASLEDVFIGLVEQGEEG